MAISGLVPTRFLTLIAHLVITITLFWGENVKSCIPTEYTQSEYDTKDTELVIALGVTLGLFAIELIGFFGGISMFLYTQGLISVAAHSSASISLAYFMFDAWPCDYYWWIFGFCSALPAFTELIVIISVLRSRG